MKRFILDINLLNIVNGYGEYFSFDILQIYSSKTQERSLVGFFSNQYRCVITLFYCKIYIEKKHDS
jgi:hypothetical protein